MTFRIWLTLDRVDIVETYEALCSIPFTGSSIGDYEPSTERCSGIEDLIKQLNSYLT